jgi:beta-aspartyl-peptidase (threonine type)
VEMDASIMDGTSKRAGAVAAVQFIRNPVSAARAVMEKSAHVMMTGNGAEAFARAQGLAMEPTNYFITPPRQQQWERAKERRAEAGERSSADAIGTVGAVALDARGRLAAATSTGGMLNKKFGRVGDSPIIGAGTYANDATCAVSATGHGEFFIRTVFAHDVSALMEYKNLSLRAAGEEAMRKLSALGGTGGFIAVDKRGEVVMPFNTEGMFRGVIHTNGEPRVAVFPE